MNYFLPEEQSQIDAAVRDLMRPFDDEYWLDCDAKAAFPFEWRQAVVDGGWLGIAMPNALGGSGLGVTDAAVMMHAVADSPGAMSACSSIHMNIFGLMPVIHHGNEAQNARWLPELISGDAMACFAVTEPDAGLDTTRITTFASARDDHYCVSGRKVWTTTAQHANRILLLARTTPIDTSHKNIDGLSLFYTRLDRPGVEIREIKKMGRHSVDTNLVFFDDFKIPAEDLIGEPGKGFRYLLEGLNPERILVAAEAIGLGRHALDRAVNYARERVVFDRPIGQNQGIAHPLAQCWMNLEAAWLMTLDAARRYDSGLECGAQANAAKYLAAQAGHDACERSVLTHGGMGYAREYHVERLLRESYIPRIAPVSGEMILNYIAERVLHLPRSY